MSFLNKKQKTTQSSKEQSTATTNRTNPDWVETPIKGFVDEIGALGKKDPLDYFAGADPLQTQAAQGAAALAPSPMWGQAQQLTQAGATAGPVSGVASSAADSIGKYFPGYVDEVGGAAIADMDVNDSRTRAQQDLDLAGSGAFGGSGAAITKSMTEGELARARASTLAGIKDSGYRFAAEMANNDANRAQSMTGANMSGQEAAISRLLAGGGQLAEIAQGFGGEQRANIGTQSAMGDVMRQIEAAKKGAPIDMLRLRQQLLTGLPLDMFGGQTTNSSGTSSGKSTTTVSDPMGTIAKAAQVAAMFASDERLKRDIVKLYERPDGLGVYLYRYLWSPVRFIGVMAQEVLRLKPEAVVTMANGYLAVDYARI